MTQPEQPVTLSPAAARVARRELCEQAASLHRQAHYHERAYRQLALRIADIQMALAELSADAPGGTP